MTTKRKIKSIGKVNDKKSPLVKKLEAENKKLEAENKKLSVQINKLRIEKQDEFDHGFGFALISLVRNYPALENHALYVFEEAGYTFPELELIPYDETDRTILFQIFKA